MSLVVTASAATPAGTLVWTAASGTDTNWLTALNWTNLTAGGYGPPGISNDVIFNNAIAGQTNFADTTTTMNSLWYRLLPLSGGTISQVTKINPGQTLNIAGTNIITGSSFMTAGYSLLVGTNNSANANGSAISAAILGAGGTLNISRPDGVVAVAQFNTGGNHPASASTRAVLDLSGLDDFSASVSQLLIGCMGNGSAGTLFLAKTNLVTVANGSATATAGVDVGNNGSNPGDPSFLYLGLTNQINANVIRAGGQNGYWGLLAFNPAFAGKNPSAVFRGPSGDASRVATWLIGDLIGATGTANVTCPAGTNDFTGGSVDVLADSFVLGKTGTGTEAALNAGTSSNRVAAGTLTFNAGTINVNNLTNGWQLTGDLTDTGIGQINVNGTGALTVNNKLVLAAGVSSSYVGGNFTGVTFVTNLYFGAAFNATNAYALGALNINGGTVLAGSIVAGGGISTIAMNNGTLVVTNTAGASASPLTAMNLTNSTLHLNINGTLNQTEVVAASLVASGVNTIKIDSVAGINGIATNHLFAYTTLAGTVAANFALAPLPAGFSGSLVGSPANKTIDLVIAPSTAVIPRFKAINLSGMNLVFNGTNGLPNGNYYVMASTNLDLPLTSWLRLSTNPFDGSGGFNFTNPLNPGALQMYYLLQLP
jgi:hypothetical protein